MRNTLFKLVLCAIAVTLVVFSRSPKRSEALNTSSCVYAYSVSNIDPLGYPCPAPTAAPVVNGTTGVWAHALEYSFGLNVHMAYGEFSNFGQILPLVKKLGVHRIREGASIVLGNNYVISSLQTFAQNGIKVDLLSDQGETVQNLNNIYSALGPGVIEAIEGPNEIDNVYFSHVSNWQAVDQFQQSQVIWPFAKAHAGIQAYGPSTAFSSYASLGDLSAYEDFGVDHVYEAGFPPETTGWGGAGYCGEIYATIKFNICNAKQASIAKPIIASEFGYQINTLQPNSVDELAQGTFDLRQILMQNILGVPRSYIYSLLDTGGQTYGLVRPDGTLRPSYTEIANFMALVSGDSADGSGQCVVPATAVSTQSTVQQIGVCRQNGEYDLVLWRPVATWDTNAITDSTIIPITATINFTNGFSPSSSTLWTYDTSGVESFNTSPNLSALQITDRVSVLRFNASASPTPLPALPTPLPAGPTPAPTPTVAPTPTPAPTTKPTIVTYIDQVGGRTSIISGQPGPPPTSSDTFGSPIQYGDFLISGWAFGERFYDYGAAVNRRVIVNPPGFTQYRAISNFPAIDPTNPSASYFAVGSQLFTSYVTDQYASTNIGSTLNWTYSLGLSNSHINYRFRGADASNPIAVDSSATSLFQTASCPSVTAPRPGSVAIALVFSSSGSNDNVHGFGNSDAPNGWQFDNNQIGVPSFSTYGFHYLTTTTSANQVLPAFQPQMTFAYLNESICEVLVIQPPA